VDEEQLLDHLDLVRLHLPAVFQACLLSKKEIPPQAEQYAEKKIKVVRAVQILNEMDIIQTSRELEAKQIQQQAQQECEVAKEQTWAEIEQMRLSGLTAGDAAFGHAIAEFEAIQ